MITLECIRSVAVWDDITQEVCLALTEGKRYEILNVEDFLVNDEEWYRLRDDMGVIAGYHYRSFSCINEEIRNDKIDSILNI
jgi:hypothetical protein